MNEFARSIFEDPQHGLAKQILNIALCECYGGNYGASNYYKLASNFELTISFSDAFEEANALGYFGGLAQKIKDEDLTQIIFKESNDFFLSDLHRGVDPYDCNKMNSGFKYRLKIPALQNTPQSE
jgi:hypothetical protein